MQYLVPAMLVIVAVIHLLPLQGALGRERIRALYGISVADPNLAILMRHRAVLFGVLGVFFLVAAFDPRLYVAAFVVGVVSVGSFLWLARSERGANAQVARVVRADVVALAALVVGMVGHAIQRAV